MKFHIKKIILWPVNPVNKIREVKFVPGCVNVITGNSKTGKSAIIPIIDYCLASDECLIPIDVIRDNVAWYGVLAGTAEGELLLVRKAPEKRKASSVFYMDEGERVEIPETIPEKETTSRDDIKELLNARAGLPNADKDDSGGENSRLGFRDVSHILFQSQGVVADQNALFYKMHDFMRQHKLAQWFPYIIGAETFEIIRKRQQRDQLEARLRFLTERLESTERLAKESFDQDLQPLLDKAITYGFIKGYDASSLPDMIAKANAIIEKSPKQSESTAATLAAESARMAKLVEEEERLSIAIRRVQLRQRRLRTFFENVTDHEKTTKKKIDRLSVSAWLGSNGSGSQVCPFCGNATHPKAEGEIQKIAGILESCQNTVKAKPPTPEAYREETEALAWELNRLLGERDEVRNRIVQADAESEDAKKCHETAQSVYDLVANLQTPVKLYNNLSSLQGMRAERDKIEGDLGQLRGEIASWERTHSPEQLLAKICNRTWERLRTLDCEALYCKEAPQFIMKDLKLQAKSKDNLWHDLDELGSASNWMSFHVAFTCALQEYFILDQTSSFVPTFTVYDQPTQVYFPRLKAKDGELLQDKDVDSAKKIFKTLVDSIKSTDGAWQAIVLEHAGEEIYGDWIGDGVEKIEEWTDGKALIESDWVLAETTPEAGTENVAGEGKAE